MKIFFREASIYQYLCLGRVFQTKSVNFLLTFTELIIALNNSVFKYACQGELRLYIFFENFWLNDPMQQELPSLK